MYPLILAVHNILRWVVVVLAIVALARAFRGWFGKRDWSQTDRKAGVFLSAALDTQLLLGLILYFGLSPITRAAFSNIGAAMANADLRFFLLEHFLYMLLAVILVHVGLATARRAVDDTAKHRRGAIWFSLAVLALVLGMPWFRPLLPGLGG
ncbi:MAG TPA: hypothetical protein VI776_04340 [Anaerolineales bacterium]|nr:hypothetical protein [Anaerolineales bacterium]